MQQLVLWHRALPPTRLENDDPEGVSAWVDQVEASAVAAGGVVLARAGGFTALAFDLTELEDALSTALGWLDEAERRTPDMAIAIGAATGELTAGPRGPTGAALDRAHLLAGRARRGELVIDAATRDSAGGVFLFDRIVGTGAAALRGTTIDRRRPHRATCRVAVAALQPARLPGLLVEELASLRTLAASSESTCLFLRGPSGSGSGLMLLTLERELAPSLVLRLGPVPSALEPLGSLRLALSDPNLDQRQKLAAEPFAALHRGEAVERSALLDALLDIAGERPWVILDPIAGLDAASLDVVAELATRRPTFLVARARMDVSLPKPLDALPWREHLVPSLRLTDAKDVARAVLADADEDVVRRVAVLGGDTLLGVVEAARWLVAAGDVIHESGRFVWRSTPRGGIRALPLDTLLHERVDSLDGPTRALLEIASLTPAGAPESVVLDMARGDGLAVGPDDLADRRRQLVHEAFLCAGAFVPTSEHLRRTVLQSMPPARRAELERFLAAALESFGPSGPLAGVTRGVSLSDGGDCPTAAQLFLRAARALSTTGWHVEARRLAAAAVQTDPRPETRAEATAVARSLGNEHQPTELGARVSQVAVNALLAGDLGAVERTVDAAVAEGRDLAAADRVRAMAYLAKGDPARALEIFERLTRNPAREPRARARSALTLAWIRLHSGAASDAVHAALEALAFVRRLKDPRGETAALHSLAACYRALNRNEDAERLEATAPA